MTIVSDLWDLIGTLDEITEEATSRDEFQFDGRTAREFEHQNLNGFTESTLHIKEVRRALHRALEAQSERGIASEVSSAIDEYYKAQDSLRKDDTGAFLDGLIVGGNVYDKLVDISKKAEVDHRRR